MKMWLPVALAAISMSGCGGWSTVPMPGGVAYSDNGQYLPPQAGPGLVADPQAAIPDVPEPIGFKPLVDRSHRSSSSAGRHVKYWYQGQADSAEVQLFYRRQLPKDGWHFVNVQHPADGSTVLRYTKGREALRVRLNQTHAVTTLVLTIEPKRPVVRAVP